MIFEPPCRELGRTPIFRTIWSGDLEDEGASCYRSRSTLAREWWRKCGHAPERGARRVVRHRAGTHVLRGDYRSHRCPEGHWHSVFQSAVICQDCAPESTLHAVLPVAHSRTHRPW